MSDSLNYAIKASQLKQNLPLTDAEQVILKTKVVKDIIPVKPEQDYDREMINDPRGDE